MKVLEFIRANENWEAALAAAPYYINASWDGDYVLLKYNQLASDFNEVIVRECRGCIFYIPNRRHEFADIVCYPFDKFGNYGEAYVPNIHWDSARVLEKVDGSLMKCWWHNGAWRVSTNGTIDARNAGTKVEGVSFYDVFMRALEKNGNSADFFQSLDQDYTYMFELVSRETRVTIEYPEAAIYYLGARNMIHLNEVQYPATTIDRLFFSFVRLPKSYPLRTIEECIKVVNSMGADEEGFVVCDGCFNRIKVKSPEYLMASRIRNNGAVTVKRIVEAMRAGYLDDFYAYAPDYREFIDSVIRTYHNIARYCENSYQIAEKSMAYLETTPWHVIVRTQILSPFRDYCFRRHAGKVKDAYDYLEHCVIESTLVDWIKSYLDINN